MTLFTTNDGRKLLIRRIRNDDAALLVDMFNHLSEQTRRLRFHCGSPKCSKELIWREAIKLCHLGPEHQAGLVAITTENDGEHVVGIARFVRSAPGDIDAEVGIVVRDDFQGVGLGTHLMFKLTQAARSMGIKQFDGWILPENRQMLQMINRTGLPIKQDTKQGETHVIVSIDKIEA